MVQGNIKKPNPNPNPNPLPSIVFHNKIFTAFSFLICLYHNFYGFFIFIVYSRLIYYMRRQYQLDYMFYFHVLLKYQERGCFGNLKAFHNFEVCLTLC